MDFVADRLEDGRPFRVLTLIDQFTRECLKLEAAAHVRVASVEYLERVAELRGNPESITVDNGTEFCSKAVDGWAYRKGVKARIHPARPAGGKMA
jgi:putative transposase